MACPISLALKMLTEELAFSSFYEWDLKESPPYMFTARNTSGETYLCAALKFLLSLKKGKKEGPVKKTWCQKFKNSKSLKGGSLSVSVNSEPTVA